MRSSPHALHFVAGSSRSSVPAFAGRRCFVRISGVRGSFFEGLVLFLKWSDRADKPAAVVSAYSALSAFVRAVRQRGAAAADL